MNRDLIETIEIYLCAVVIWITKLHCYNENLFVGVIIIIITRSGFWKWDYELSVEVSSLIDQIWKRIEKKTDNEGYLENRSKNLSHSPVLSALHLLLNHLLMFFVVSFSHIRISLLPTTPFLVSTAKLKMIDKLYGTVMLHSERFFCSSESCCIILLRMPTSVDVHARNFENLQIFCLVIYWLFIDFACIFYTENSKTPKTMCRFPFSLSLSWICALLKSLH